MYRFKQKKYIPLIVPLILLIAVLAANQDWSIAGGTSYTYTNTAKITGFTDSFGAHTLTQAITAKADVVVTTTGTPSQEILCLTPPVLTADAGPDTSTNCTFGVTLGGSSWTATGGTQPYTYQWSCDQPVCNISVSTDANPTVNPDFRETIYTVVVIDGNSCIASDSVLVTVEDAPQAVAIASPTVACVNQTVTFDGSGSIGASLSYDWDFGDGTLLPAGPATYTYSYSTEGIFNASLTVTDAAGCKDSAFIDIYIADPGELVGRISFDFGPTSIFADGSSITSVTSSPVTDCLGNPLGNILITVMTDRGTILNAQLIDEDSAPGIQISTDISGRISFTLQSDNIGGMATVMARSVDGNAEGASQIEFLWSTSLPIVTGFYPSGYLEAITSVSDIYVQFNKDMDETSVCNPINFYVMDVTGAPTPVNGTCEYNEEDRTAIFTPTGGPLNTMNRYEVTVTGNVVDDYVNSLDGDYDGLPELSPTDDFTWTFGNTMDRDDPTITCGGHAPEPFSPDGDGIDDSTTINAHIQDIGMPPSGIKMWQVLIRDGAGNVIRTLIERVEEAATDINGSMAWDGKDEDGMVVDNGTYNYIVRAIDNDGNWFIAVCNDEIRVNSAIDPAYFRGSSTFAPPAAGP